MSEISGGEFIAKINPEIQKSIDNSVKQYQRQETKENPNLKPDKAGDRVEAHLLRMETALRDSEPDRAKRKLEIFKAMIYPQILINQDNIPNSYFELQQRIARERGRGEIRVTPKTRQEAGQTILTDQKKSLDVWFDYMLDSASPYPSWFKYYILKNVTGLGSYDKETKQFLKRTDKTTNIFPDLNREALSFVYDVIVQKNHKGVNKTNSDFKRIVDSANFAKIYAYAIDKITPASKENKEITEGGWVKYDQGSDHTPLYESLQGHDTGWCTAGQETAKSQLQMGDFYVYYTKDQDVKNTIPRIAIRMQNGQVDEVRGIGKEQNLEDCMIDIAKEKYSKLPGGDKFEKKDSDMKQLTLIDKKVIDNIPLTPEELRFLYEIDSEIVGFGYQKDPRIEEIISNRDIKQDLSLVFNYSPDQISLAEKEALKGNIKLHFGSLRLSGLTSAKGIVLPETIGGDLWLSGLTSAKGIVLPETIGGDLWLSGLTSAKGIVLPKAVGSSLRLPGLTSAKGLVLPETVGGDLDLSGLTSAKGLVLPETVGGDLDLSGLTSAKGLVLPKTVDGYLSLSNLTSAKGLVLPESINGDLILCSLTSAKGLVLPENVVGNLWLSGLILAEKETVKRNYPNLDIL